MRVQDVGRYGRLSLTWVQGNRMQPFVVPGTGDFGFGSGDFGSKKSVRNVPFKSAIQNPQSKMATCDCPVGTVAVVLLSLVPDSGRGKIDRIRAVGSGDPSEPLSESTT